MSKKRQNGHLGGNIIGGDPNTYYPDLWKHLIDTFGATSVLDVGCGEGNALSWFRDQGLEAFGIDGLPENVKITRSKGIKCEEIDFTVSQFKDRTYDLIWCCEVVEHVEERFVQNLIDTFKCGEFVAMTHALPRQGGYHHVNCKPKEYWTDHMVKNGFKYLEKETIEAKNFEPQRYFNRSGLIFEKA